MAIANAELRIISRRVAGSRFIEFPHEFRARDRLIEIVDRILYKSLLIREIAAFSICIETDSISTLPVYFSRDCRSDLAIPRPLRPGALLLFLLLLEEQFNAGLVQCDHRENA